MSERAQWLSGLAAGRTPNRDFEPQRTCWCPECGGDPGEPDKEATNDEAGTTLDHPSDTPPPSIDEG